MSAISAIGNLVKSITQRLPGMAQGNAGQKAQGDAGQKAQGDAGQKAQAAAPQTVGDGNDLDDDVKSLLAANQPAWWWIVSAFGVLAAGAIGSYYLWKWRHPADFMPSSDYATYAGLFIMALAVERILEPFSSLIVRKTQDKKAKSRVTAAKAKRAQTAAIVSGAHAAAAASAGQAKRAAVAQQAAANKAAAARTAAADAQKKAALAQAAFHRSQGARAVMMWATASVLAMAVCALLGIFLLRSVETPRPATTSAGASASAPAKDPNRLLDLLVTGLVVGAGTKPLHDLITQIQTSSGTSKAKASSPTTTN
jgi:hypothetical protein